MKLLEAKKSEPNRWNPTRIGTFRAVARKGGGEIKLVMIQSSHRFGLAASSPNLSESSLAGWVPALRLRSAQPRAVRAAKLDSDKFGSSRRDQTGGLIESRQA